MPFLQGSGQISIANLNGFFSGLSLSPSGVAMSNFYRGGWRVPSIKIVTVREPTSGELYNFNNTFWYTGPDNYQLFIKWGNTWLVYALPGWGNATSYTVGAYTYFRGNLNYDGTGYGGDNMRGYGIWRTSFGSQDINTGIPSSGQISLSQFYGAERP